MDSSSSNGKREQESGDITKPSAKKQKLGERKSDVEVEGDSGYLIPLRLTARSGYLAVEEVARLLLFTGKTFMGNIFGDLQNNLGQTIPSITGGTPRIADVGPFRYVHNVEVIRNAETEVFGFQIHPLASREKDSIGCQIVKAQPLLQSSSVIEKDDVITSINGKDVRGWTFSNTVRKYMPSMVQSPAFRFEDFIRVSRCRYGSAFVSTNGEHLKPSRSLCKVLGKDAAMEKQTGKGSF